jgi:hypothetical protein
MSVRISAMTSSSGSEYAMGVSDYLAPPSITARKTAAVGAELTMFMPR